MVCWLLIITDKPTLTADKRLVDEREVVRLGHGVLFVDPSQKNPP